MPKITPKRPTTIDAYLATVPAEQRAALEKLRTAIRKLVPDAEEGISYGLAAFRLNGRPFVAFGASTHHCAFYPMSSTVVATLRDELQGYDVSKGTIRFPADRPLPLALLRHLIRVRLVETGATPKRAMKPSPTNKKRSHGKSRKGG